MAAHRCHFKRHEPDYYIWDSFLDELDDSPSSSITNTPASVPHHSHDKVHPVAHTPPLPPSDIYLRELQAVLPDLENGSNQEQRNIAPMAFFEAHRRMGKGNSGTVYRLRNTQILCKAISTSEGRCGYYRRHHFLCEVNVYSRLRGLQGKAIPKFYGAYETPDKKKGLIFLEDCGRCLSWLWWSDMHPVER